MPDPIIVTHGLTRRFGDTLAVDDLTLEVHAGEVVGPDVLDTERTGARATGGIEAHGPGQQQQAEQHPG